MLGDGGALRLPAIAIDNSDVDVALAHVDRANLLIGNGISGFLDRPLEVCLKFVATDVGCRTPIATGSGILRRKGESDRQNTQHHVVFSPHDSLQYLPL